MLDRFINRSACIHFSSIPQVTVNERKIDSTAII